MKSIYKEYFTEVGFFMKELVRITEGLRKTMVSLSATAELSSGKSENKFKGKKKIVQKINYDY